MMEKSRLYHYRKEIWTAKSSSRAWSRHCEVVINTNKATWLQSWHLKHPRDAPHSEVISSVLFNWLLFLWNIFGIWKHYLYPTAKHLSDKWLHGTGIHPHVAAQSTWLQQTGDKISKTPSLLSPLCNVSISFNGRRSSQMLRKASKGCCFVAFEKGRATVFTCCLSPQTDRSACSGWT